jgi:hypothetical protein
MREGLSLCPHLAALAPGPAPFTLAPDEILAYQDGPLAAVVRCRACGACGWLELIDWAPGNAARVYALAPIRAEDVALYFRDRARGSCDVGRLEAELAALVASAGRFERVVALRTAPLEVVAVEAAAAGSGAPSGAALDLARLESGPWLRRFGLAKGAPH